VDEAAQRVPRSRPSERCCSPARPGRGRAGVPRHPARVGTADAALAAARAVSTAVSSTSALAGRARVSTRD
jgi:hypothetical protein